MSTAGIKTTIVSINRRPINGRVGALRCGRGHSLAAKGRSVKGLRCSDANSIEVPRLDVGRRAADAKQYRQKDQSVEGGAEEDGREDEEEVPKEEMREIKIRDKRIKNQKAYSKIKSKCARPSSATAISVDSSEFFTGVNMCSSDMAMRRLRSPMEVLKLCKRKKEDKKLNKSS